MAIEFHWDPAKAAANQRKHRVSFKEALTVFADPHAMIDYDDKHSTVDEDRWLIIGLSARGRVLLVVFSDDMGIIRLISAWRANRRELDGYQRYRK